MWKYLLHLCTLGITTNNATANVRIFHEWWHAGHFHHIAAVVDVVKYSRRLIASSYDIWKFSWLKAPTTRFWVLLSRQKNILHCMVWALEDRVVKISLYSARLSPTRLESMANLQRFPQADVWKSRTGLFSCLLRRTGTSRSHWSQRWLGWA